MDDELKSILEAMRQENAAAQKQNAAAHAETRRHFDVLAEAVKHEIRLVAEGLDATNERLSREAADIRMEMRTGFAETQAMFKFSHAELDRRVTVLEGSHRSMQETLTDVQARLERLEDPTH